MIIKIHSLYGCCNLHGLDYDYGTMVSTIEKQARNVSSFRCKSLYGLDPTSCFMIVGSITCWAKLPLVKVSSITASCLPSTSIGDLWNSHWCLPIFIPVWISYIQILSLFLYFKIVLKKNIIFCVFKLF